MRERKKGRCMQGRKVADVLHVEKGRGRMYGYVGRKGKIVGRLAKATFIHISIHLYSSNVVTSTKLGDKQQNILNLCLLLTYIIVHRVY
jgi:hypothetical protein